MFKYLLLIYIENSVEIHVFIRYTVSLTGMMNSQFNYIAHICMNYLRYED